MSSPAWPFCERLTMRTSPSARYWPVNVTGRHSIVVEITGRLGQQRVELDGGSVVAGFDRGVELSRSSSRRSCQKPRLIIATTAAITTRWNTIQLRRIEEAVHGCSDGTGRRRRLRIHLVAESPRSADSQSIRPGAGGTGSTGTH